MVYYINKLLNTNFKLLTFISYLSSMIKIFFHDEKKLDDRHFTKVLKLSVDTIYTFQNHLIGPLPLTMTITNDRRMINCRKIMI